MTLSFGGKYSLDELEKLAREKFSAVVNKDVVVP
jgi:secreted Zn-dependent insulinase-like peptidase